MTGDAAPSREFLTLQDALRGRYALEREIGRGGMGVVFLARDAALERPVAIKLLLPHLAHDERLHERFLREARTAAQLMHPNIVPIHAVESQDALVYFVMAYVDGETLSERVARRGPLAPEDALRVMRDVTWALAYAHGRGVVHRDIKPDNILIEHATGRALVADFGIARVTARDTLTDEGAFVGTVQYMSPEQASAEPVDGRSDVYSLGSTIYFALTGASPVEGPTLPSMLARLATEESPNVLLARPDTPPQFAALLTRAMARDRERRVESADALTVELQALEGHEPAVRPEVRGFVREIGSSSVLLFLGIITAMLGTIFLFSGEMVPHEVAGVVSAIGAALAILPVAAAVGQLRTLRTLGVPIQDIERGLTDELRNMERHRRRVLSVTGLNLRSRTLGWFIAGIGGLATGVSVNTIAHGAAFPALYGLTVVTGAYTACGVALIRGWTPTNVVTRNLFGVQPSLKGGVDDFVLASVRWLVRRGFIGRLFRPREGSRRAVDAPSTAPTATLLLKRVEDLVKQLPPDVRSRLPDIAPVCSHLERAGAALRARVGQLDRASAELPPSSPARAEFAAARNRAASRLMDCLAALEAVRTDLLRLSVGLGQSDGLTLALEKARELGSAVDAELHGADEVRKLLA